MKVYWPALVICLIDSRGRANWAHEVAARANGEIPQPNRLPAVTFIRGNQHGNVEMQHKRWGIFIKEIRLRAEETFYFNI